MSRLGAIALLLAACVSTPASDRTSAPLASLTPTPARSEATATRPVPTSSSSPRPGVTPVGLQAKCVDTDALAPDGAVCPTRLAADLDGDGRPDTVVLWSAKTDRLFDGTLQALVLFASGARRTTAISFAPVVNFPLFPTAAADVNGDGRDELFVQVDHGASTATWVLVVWDGMDFVLASRDGHVASFPINGSVTHGGGLECRRTSQGRYVLTKLGIGSVGLVGPGPLSYDTFNWDEEDLAISNGVLTTVAKRAGTASRAEVSDPAGPFAWYWSFHCPNVSLR